MAKLYRQSDAHRLRNAANNDVSGFRTDVVGGTRTPSTAAGDEIAVEPAVAPCRRRPMWRQSIPATCQANGFAMSQPPNEAATPTACRKKRRKREPKDG
jgi:hypothetical protein